MDYHLIGNPVGADDRIHHKMSCAEEDRLVDQMGMYYRHQVDRVTEVARVNDGGDQGMEFAEDDEKVQQRQVGGKLLSPRVEVDTDLARA